MLYAVTYSASYPFNKKKTSSYGHELVWKLLYLAMEREHGLSKDSLQMSYGLFGKPEFSNVPVFFSLSHCPGLVCCALSEKPVGVDAEAVFRCSLQMAKRICTEGELAFLKRSPDKKLALAVLWTLKESRMKQSGEGFHFGFQNAAFSFSDLEGLPSGISPEGAPELCAGSYTCIPGFVISVCGEEAPPKEPILVKEDQLF